MKATRHAWPEIVPPKLLMACGDHVASIAKQVQDGVSHLYHLKSELSDVWVVTRGEEFPEGKELVIVCVGGEGMEQVGQFLIDNARALGFDCIRYHASNPATHRLYNRYGFGGVEVERVYKVDLGGGHGFSI